MSGEPSLGCVCVVRRGRGRLLRGLVWRGRYRRRGRRMSRKFFVGVSSVGVGIGEGEGGGLVVAGGGGEFEWAEEYFEVEAEGVEGGHEGDEEAEDAEIEAGAFGRVDGVADDFVLGEEAGEGRGRRRERGSR